MREKDVSSDKLAHLVELSIVVPVYSEEQNIRPFCAAIRKTLESVPITYELIFAADPSPDGTIAAIEEVMSHDHHVRYLLFSRRFGQAMATLGGLAYASGKAAVVMDSDFQDPPALVPQMVSLWHSGYDVVLARRRSKEREHWLRRFAAYVAYRVIRWISEIPMPTDTGDFRLMSRRVVEAVVSLPEKHGYLRGLVSWVGFRQTTIEFDRPSRQAGRTHYNAWFGSLQIALNGLFGFSLKPLVVAAWLACLLLFMAIAFLGAMAASRRSWQTEHILLIAFLIVSSAQFLVSAIIGQYLGRIYDEVRHRPKYIVDRVAGFPGPRSGIGS